MGLGWRGVALQVRTPLAHLMFKPERHEMSSLRGLLQKVARR